MGASGVAAVRCVASAYRLHCPIDRPVAVQVALGLTLAAVCTLWAALGGEDLVSQSGKRPSGTQTAMLFNPANPDGLPSPAELSRM